MKHSGGSLPLGTIVAVIAVGAVLAYAAFASASLFQQPSVLLNELVHRAPGVVVLSGTTQFVSKLTVNGVDVALGEDGSFSIERAFPPGYTVIMVEASDRFGREVTYTRTVINN